MRAAILVWYWCTHDENSQVNGTKVLFDLTDLSVYFCTHVWNVDNLRKKLKFYEVIIITVIIIIKIIIINIKRM